jgi:broad specificity phosphatase PhoE
MCRAVFTKVLASTAKRAFDTANITLTQLHHNSNSHSKDQQTPDHPFPIIVKETLEELSQGQWEGKSRYVAIQHTIILFVV